MARRAPRVTGRGTIPACRGTHPLLSFRHQMSLERTSPERRRVNPMPPVDLCTYCQKEIDTTKEKFVVVTVPYQNYPRAIAHVECQQKQARGMTP